MESAAPTPDVQNVIEIFRGFARLANHFVGDIQTDHLAETFRAFPTSRASSRVAQPEPQPRSSTRSPGRSPSGEWSSR